MELIFSLREIGEAAKKFISYLGNRKVAAFHGNLGAGKTTLTKEVCKQLGVKETVSSPTFSIINEYKTDAGKKIFHIDLYRLKDMEEAINAGVEDCIYSGNLCFIEWPEKIFSILPDNTAEIFIETIDGGKRKLTCKLLS